MSDITHNFAKIRRKDFHNLLKNNYVRKKDGFFCEKI